MPLSCLNSIDLFFLEIKKPSWPRLGFWFLGGWESRFDWSCDCRRWVSEGGVLLRFVERDPEREKDSGEWGSWEYGLPMLFAEAFERAGRVGAQCRGRGQKISSSLPLSQAILTVSLSFIASLLSRHCFLGFLHCEIVCYSSPTKAFIEKKKWHLEYLALIDFGWNHFTKQNFVPYDLMNTLICKLCSAWLYVEACYESCVNEAMVDVFYYYYYYFV